MNTLKISAIALTVGMTLSASTMAASITKEEYKSTSASIDAAYKVAKGRCSSFSGNAKDICVVDAKGKMNVANAELEANYTPNVSTQYNLRVAKADAAYAVANEKCDDKAGNAKDVCVKEAKAAQTHEAADAKAQLKTEKAVAQADEKTVDARVDASAEKSEADYAVAKEKCDALAGDTKEQCRSEAKLKFAKH